MSGDTGSENGQDGETERAPEIRQLDQQTVQRIAAGEVVERPASVVKELVENSLDADASRIEVAVKSGGTEYVKVADDGVGMSEEQVETAVEKHTTSKIRDIDDLEAGVGTLGFRGEALHTIGAVSRTTITTRPRNGADSATELRFEGGEVAAVRPAGRPAGTTVEVADLFFNTPARRKYLSSEATEFAHVNRVVTRYALANSDIAFSLTHNGNRTFRTTGQGDLQGALLAVYGREVAESMVEVDETFDEGPVDRVHGYVSDPEVTRSTREYVSTYVNGRYVTDATAREGVLAAYGNQIAADRFPFAVLFLDLPAGDVDVNVHPRKMEVRYGDEDSVKRAVRNAVQDALLEDGLVRSRAPRGRSAPGDAEITPDAGDEGEGIEDSGEKPRTGGGDATDGEAAAANDDPQAASLQSNTDVDRAWSPPNATSRAGNSSAISGPSVDRIDDGAGDESDNGSDDDPDDGTVSPTATAATDTQASNDASATDEAPQDERPERGRATRTGGSSTARPATNSAGKPATAADTATTDSSTDTDGTGSTTANRKFRREAGNTRLTDDALATDEEHEFDRLPRMRVLGQYQETYVVAETPDGLVLVDQHAADERVNYEELRERLAERRESQSLVAPVELELTAGEAAVFDDAVADLRDLGFDAELDGRTAVVTAVPAVFADALDPELLRDVLAEFVGTTDPEAVESAADGLLADLSCKPAIKGNTSLREGDVLDLLDRLDDCENPYACPHGRPVVVEFSAGEIDDRFERDYPGHAVRRPEH